MGRSGRCEEGLGAATATAATATQPKNEDNVERMSPHPKLRRQTAGDGAPQSHCTKSNETGIASFPSIRLLLLLRWRSECVVRHDEICFSIAGNRKSSTFFLPDVEGKEGRLAGERLVRSSRRINEFVYRSVGECAKRGKEN